MEQLCFKVAEVEGPLDLILQLLSKHKIEIYDIEITNLLEQYLKAIEEIQSNLQDGMEIASEFLEMAAKLVYMKSVSLLPKYEEADALKQELTGQLLEYQLCKQMAQKLKEKNRLEDIFVRKQAKIDIDMTYHGNHHKSSLIDAYLTTIGRGKRKLPPPKEAFAGILNRRVVSIRSRIVKIMNSLFEKDNITLNELYIQSEDRSELVATFLAVLTLLKEKKINISENSMQKVTLAENFSSKNFDFSVFDEND
ncbi:MAG: segregation/condensation protein A [Oscillospiraceae bacterium]